MGGDRRSLPLLLLLCTGWMAGVAGRAAGAGAARATAAAARAAAGRAAGARGAAATAAAAAARHASTAAALDVRGRLSTKAPYAHRVPTRGAPALDEVPDPLGYEPVFLYLLARHGSRWPTASRAAQMAGLAPLLKVGAAAGLWGQRRRRRGGGGGQRRCCGCARCMHAPRGAAWRPRRRGQAHGADGRAPPMRAPAPSPHPRAQMVDARRHPWAANFSAPFDAFAAGELHPTGAQGALNPCTRAGPPLAHAALRAPATGRRPHPTSNPMPPRPPLHIQARMR
jgi:hypothetical protein